MSRPPWLPDETVPVLAGLMFRPPHDGLRVDVRRDDIDPQRIYVHMVDPLKSSPVMQLFIKAGPSPIVLARRINALIEAVKPYAR